MKGYIYTMFAGADPAEGWTMTDPIYGKVPTLGACMPNIRKAVERNDYIFSISGRVQNVKQYVVGGFSVDEKINALSAYKRLPENRMRVGIQGELLGNIIVDSKGKHLDIDYHRNQESRIENYIIGKDPIVVEGAKNVDKARKETLNVLNDLFGKNEDTISKVIGRWRKLDEVQIKDLLAWMSTLRKR
jgi:hypothetical protein